VVPVERHFRQAPSMFGCVYPRSCVTGDCWGAECPFYRALHHLKFRHEPRIDSFFPLSACFYSTANLDPGSHVRIPGSALDADSPAAPPPPGTASYAGLFVPLSCFLAFPTEVSVSSPGMPEAYPENWVTFCAEGSTEGIEAFLGGAGKPLVALLSHRGALQVGYPQFVRMISTA